MFDRTGSSAPHPQRLGHQRLGSLLLTAVAVIVLLTAVPVLAADPDQLLPLPSSEVRYQGADGLLPLDEDELLAFLASADIVASKTLSEGINRTRKLTLERDGVRAHAVFRTVDQTVHEGRGTQPNRFVFRDSYRYEVAAYRLSRLLGIHRVPPTVLRTVDGQPGSVQLWIENARTAEQAIADGLALRSPATRHLQRQLMYGFDQLVFNFDRHLGNILYDERDRMWFIDHTRSFKLLPQLSQTQLPVLSDRAFYDALQGLDRDTARSVLRDVLSRLEIDAMMRRRALLLRHFDRLMAEHGSESVLVDVGEVVRPPERARARPRPAAFLGLGLEPALLP